MEESRSMGASNSLQFQQEQMALLDICIHDERLQRTIEMPKAPATMKQVFVNLVSGLACYTRLDLVLSWIFDRLTVWPNPDISAMDIKKDREWKKWLLNLLKQVLIDSANDQYTYRQTLEMAPTILAGVMSFLDTMDSVDYLPIIIETFTVYSQQYPDFFNLRFTDIIDLLVGWNMDEAIPDSKKSILISAYGKFGSFWAKYLPFTMVLLGHFLSDMESIFSELEELYTTNMTKYNQKWENCTTILSCYGTILETVLPFISEIEIYENKAQLEYSLDMMLPKLLQILTKSLNHFPDILWTNLSRDILMLFVCHGPLKYSQYQYPIYLFLAEKTEDRVPSEPLKHVETLIQLINLWESNISKEVFERILDIDISPLFALRKRYPGYKEVESSIVSLLRSLVRSKTSHANRSHVNQMLIDSLEKKKKEIDFLGEDPEYTPDNLTRIMSILQTNRFTLKDVDKTKSSEPCEKEDLEEEIKFLCYFLLDTTRLWPEFRSKNILAIANTFFTAWAFIRTDLCEYVLDIMLDCWSSSNYMLDDENDFVVMTQLLSDLIDYWSDLSYRLRKYVCNFVHGLLDALSETSAIQFDYMEDLKGIISSLISVPEFEVIGDIKKDVIDIITKYSFVYGSSGFIDSFLHSVKRSVNSTNLGIQNASKDLTVSLNPFLISHASKVNDDLLLKIQNIFMSTPHTGSFRPIHYEITMQRLGIGQHLLVSHDELHKELDNAPDWAKRIFYTCDILNSMQSVPLLKEIRKEIPIHGLRNLIDDSQTLTSYWSTWESARYCILSRLRTPFGNPQQTLAALERTLNTFVSDESKSDLSKNSSLQNLLLLLNSLEIQISNATNGCATGALPIVPRPSLLFFRTNKKTCQDYFTRIRPNIIKGAKISGYDDVLMTHLMTTLKEIQGKMLPDPILWFKEVNCCMRDLVEVYIKKNHADMINGLRSWFRRAIYDFQRLDPEFKKKWSFEGYIGPLSKISNTSETKTTTWFKTAELFASGSYELAIESLSELRSMDRADENGIIDMLTRQAINFYACMEDYSSIGNILTSVSEINDDFLYQSLRDFNSEEHILKDQANAFQGLQNFVNIAPLETCTELNRLGDFKNWLIPDPEKNKDITLQIENRMRDSYKSGINSNITNLLELQLLNTDWDHLVAGAEDWCLLQADNNSYSLSDTKHWARLNAHFEHLHKLNGTTDSTSTHAMSSVQIHTAKVARRQGNTLFAEKLIDRATQSPDSKYKALYERAKILFNQSDYTQAMENLNTIITHVASAPEHKELGSKTYRSIARYLQSCPEDQASDLLEKLESSFVRPIVTEMQSPVEVYIDHALEKSIETNTIDGRPWFEYATHHYKQAWRILEEIVQPEPTMAIVLWAKEQIQMNLVGADETLDKKKIEKMLFELLTKYSSSIENNSCSSCQPLMNSLRQLVPFLNQENENGIVSVYDTLHKMVIDKFHASAQAYFHYLYLDIHISQQDDMSTTSMVTTATLRILRILSKYGTSLQDVYHKNVDNVRVGLWKHVTPQLFAQLNHPSEFVRQTISRFILVICESDPRELMYDVIVSTNSSKTNRETIKTLEMITNHIKTRDALLWVSTTQMAEEIQAMTVLIEEAIIDMIGTLQFDVMQKFRDLDAIYVKLAKTSMEASEKEKVFMENYRSCMDHTIGCVDSFMESLNSIERDNILTPHHEWFLKTYGKHIKEAHALLLNPTCAKEYREGWTLFQNVHGVLMADTHKLRILELSQVSPYLYSLKNTSIGMPGQSSPNLWIDSFGTNVVVIPTKTKPKKLDFRGSDGKRYTYLFKGHEDLHLDERIMQLLTTTNGLLSENRTTASRGMRARTYAVIPLRDRSGMIQWVDDATPLFALYKQWQKRESAAHMVLTNDKPNEAILAAIAKRPTEQFNERVYAALKEAGLRVSSNRKNWPKHILRKVYSELAKETPKDLLEKELYYSSPTAEEWINKSNSFARSLAVTSMIGYIIGLGDRHLDNMLVDFKSGEMVHIDYGVCFEKGRSLRVPERVPYRLTQNLFSALGVLGVDGPFRAAAEETMRVLRKHKEVLITLLDAFVYDPLVDWEYEAEEAGHRQMKELQRSLGLLAVQINQNHAQLGYDYQTIADQLTGLEESVRRWQVFGSDYMVDDEESEEDEDPATGDFEQNGNETAGYQVPIYVLETVKEQLLSFRSIVSKARSPLEGILPLLESIIIIEADEDNELLPAQKAAKSVFDVLARMNEQLKRLEKQIGANRDCDSEWTYAQLSEFVQLTQKLYREYCSSLKILEEFGPEKTSSMSAVVIDESNSSTVPAVDDTEQAEHHRDAAESQTNNLPKTTHVEKIMKRLRAKLEGDDFGAQRMSVPEQVRRTIEQAISPDNLCLMYEGWTSWI
ncbi:unnamed protein product [Rhizopus stolonifer]